MMNKTKITFSLLLLLAIATSVAAQARQKKPRELADYTPRTLNEISQLQGTSAETFNINVRIQGEIFPTRVKVVYGHSSRAVSTSTKNAIAAWANRYAGATETYTAPYQREVVFSENGQRYWLAVRKELLTRFEEELSKGDTVELFLIKLGSARNGDKWEPVLLVEKFLKP
ncbi:MAG TPA: hypothetical protein VFT48_04640 [Pyrinomonadaceae bacterium]|nr:hypothetical protein [Pyrinomonadaceae bacterium]